MTDPPFAVRVIDEFVKPLYRGRLNGPVDLDRADLISKTARQASAEEIVWMLEGDWRPRRVGAWFTFVRREFDVRPVLLRSLVTSLGTLTAPDLGFAAVRWCGADALPALHEYQTIALREGYGGLSATTALIEYAGGSSALAESTDDDRLSLSYRVAWADHFESA